MLQEALDEFIDGKRHEFGLFAAIIKRHFAVLNLHNPTVGNGSPAKVARKIGQNTVTVGIFFAYADVPFLWRGTLVR